MNAEKFLKDREGNENAYIPYDRVLDMLEKFGKIKSREHLEEIYNTPGRITKTIVARKLNSIR